MNKLFTKIASLTVGLAMAIGVGVAIGKGSKDVKVAEAAAQTLTAGENQLVYTHDFTTKPTASADNTLSTITWTANAGTRLNNYNSSYKGVQIGSNGNSGAFQLTSKYAWGSQTSTSFTGYPVVKKIALYMNHGGGTMSATVTIGGTAATSDGTTVEKNSSATSQREGTTKVEYAPASGHDTGIIVISYSSSSKAGYFCSIQVLCEKPSIHLTGGITPIRVGQTTTLTSDVDGVTWNSNNTNVATVDGGVVTAVAEGNATITATKSGYITGTFALTVEAAATEPTVDLDVKSVSGTSNDGVLYELNASAAGFTNDAAVVFTWNVVESTLGVIEYDSEDGYFAFTLEKGGTATITVTGTYAAESESDTETCSVTVTQSKVSVIDIPSSTSVYAGMTVDLEAELTIVGTPTQSQQTVTWVSSNAKATVEASPSDSKQATVTGVSAGEAIITAFVDLNGNGACDVGEINDTCTVTITTIEIYTQITDAKYIYAGMKVVIGCSSQNEVITTAPTSSNKYFATAATAANISAGKLPSSNALEFTITGTVGNWTLTTDGGYVMADDASKDMVLSGGTSTWSITISGGNAVIIDTNENQGWQLMRNNSLSRIKAYVVGGQTAIQLYAKDEADTEQGHIYSFIRNNMRMGDTALAGNGTGACTSSGYYSSAKTAFNGAGLTASERAAFFNEANTQYAAARARLTAWASANGESFNTTENVLKAARTDIGIVANHTNNSQVLIIVLISTLSILSIGVYFFIRKRKEQN